MPACYSPPSTVPAACTGCLLLAAYHRQPSPGRRLLTACLRPYRRLAATCAHGHPRQHPSLGLGARMPGVRLSAQAREGRYNRSPHSFTTSPLRHVAPLVCRLRAGHVSGPSTACGRQVWAARGRHACAVCAVQWEHAGGADWSAHGRTHVAHASALYMGCVSDGGQGTTATARRRRRRPRGKVKRSGRRSYRQQRQPSRERGDGGREAGEPPRSWPPRGAQSRGRALDASDGCAPFRPTRHGLWG